MYDLCFGLDCCKTGAMRHRSSPVEGNPDLLAAVSKLLVPPFLSVVILSGCIGSFSHLTTQGKESTLFAQRPVRAMANEVGVGLPGGGVLAVEPLRAEETGIPEGIAQGIEETFAEQLQAGKPGLKIKSRRDLRKIWDETALMSRSRLEDELRGMEVDYLVVPTALPFSEGIDVSFRAYDIREGARSRLIGASLSRNVRIASPQVLAVPPEQAAAYTARGLYAKIARRFGTDAGGFTMRAGGETSPFIGYISGLVITALEEIRAASGTEQFSAGDLVLKTEVRDDGDWASVVFLVEDAEGQEIARRSAVLDTKLIAEDHKPLTPSATAIEQTVYSAIGQARIGPALSERQALAAARMRARGDVVQQALGVRRTFRDPAQTLGAAHWAMGVLGPGLPFEEVWSREETDDPNLVRMHLKARVRRFDQALAEGVQARLSPENVRPGTPIGVVLSGQRDGFAGVFLWQADGTVSRAFPSGDRPHLEMKAGQTLFLPREDDAPVATHPADGTDQDLGAMVVVVSATPLDFRKFDGDGADSGFLDGLAEQDAESMSVRVLPFISRASDSIATDVKP